MDNAVLPVSRATERHRDTLGVVPGDLRSLLQRVFRVTITDGRYFVGRFTCVDQNLNLVLSDAEEYLPAPTTEQEHLDRMYRNAYFPTSQRGEVDLPGWDGYVKATGDEGQGRMIGLVLICGDDAVKIELMEEVEMPQAGKMHGHNVI